MSCKPCKAMPFMRHKVTIQSPKTTLDALGQIDLSNDANWTTVATRSCSFKTRGGSESYLFNQVDGEVRHLVDMRSDTTTRAIKASWRIVFDGRKFDIRAAYDVDEMRQTVRLELTEHE